MKHTKLTLLAAALGLALTCAACNDDNNDNNQDGNKVDKEGAKAAYEAAKDSLAACNYVEAYKSLSDAYSKDKSDKNIAFEHGIVRLLNIVNNEEVKKILPKLGFSNDNLNFVWDSQGLLVELDKLRNDEETDFERFMDRLPIIALQEETDFVDSLDRNFKFSDAMPAAKSLKTEFLAIADSLTIAADAIASNNEVISISRGSCGLNKFTFEATDLYLIASALQMVSAGIELASAYDMDVNVYQYFNYLYNNETYCDSSEEECQTACTNTLKLNDILGDHLFKIVAANAAKPGKDHILAAADNILKGVSEITDSTGAALFKWNKLPTGIKKDVSGLAELVKNNADGKINLGSYVTPAITGDLNKLFNTPPTFQYDKFLTCKVEFYEYCWDYTCGEDIDYWDCDENHPNYTCTEKHSEYFTDETSELEKMLVSLLNGTVASDIVKYTVNEEGWGEIEGVADYSFNFSSSWTDFYWDELLP